MSRPDDLILHIKSHPFASSRISRELSIWGTNELLYGSAIKLKHFGICGTKCMLVCLFDVQKIDDVNVGVLKRIHFRSVF